MTLQHMPAPAAPGRRAIAVPDAVVALVVIALGVFTVLDSRRITVPLSANVVGPRAFPSVVGVALLLSGTAVLVQALRGHAAEPEAGEDVDTEAGTDWLTMAKFVAAFAVHVVLVERIGWALAAGLLFGGVAWALGARWWRGLAIGWALGFVIQALFVTGLGVSLPAGFFQGVPFLDG
jgi:putative tricarboxylic transport membrane protein